MAHGNRHLFLDLEDTIITPVTQGWDTATLINVEKVRAFIERFQPDHLSIFSFAIWNQAELAKFKASSLCMIERALGTKVDWMPTVDDDILPACCRQKGLALSRVDFSDLSDFWGKAGSFRLFAAQQSAKLRAGAINSDIELALLDDAVEDEDFSMPRLGLKGMTRNIDRMG